MPGALIQMTAVKRGICWHTLQRVPGLELLSGTSGLRVPKASTGLSFPPFDTATLLPALPVPCPLLTARKQLQSLPPHIPPHSCPGGENPISSVFYHIPESYFRWTSLDHRTIVILRKIQEIRV